MSKLILALYVLTTSFGLIVLKLGANTDLPINIIGNKLQLNINLFSLSGIFLYCLSFVLYIYLISKYDLGYIIPLVTALVYIVIFVASFIIFKEAFTLVKILGITFIILGLVLLNIQKAASPDSKATAAHEVTTKP